MQFYDTIDKGVQEYLKITVAESETNPYTTIKTSSSKRLKSIISKHVKISADANKEERLYFDKNIVDIT